ncbi:phospholipid scramblase 2-like isoform X2 [Halichondria panicea]|uniref:phospholipid scramblase 2-like isoform X2 n=1 Tax=Halichondria panicea TaxID=6063 RepID=UPI00312B738D
MADQGDIPLGETSSSHNQVGPTQPSPSNPEQPPPVGQPATQPLPPLPYPAGQPGQPASQPPPQLPYPAGQPGQPAAAPYPGQPAHLDAGHPPQQAGVYPPPPPGPQPPPGAGYGAGFAGAFAGALGAAQQPQQVQWMAAPTDAPSDCPPGLEYLIHIDQILVNQQIEIFEIITNFETENKYRIRNTLGQQVYFAAEESSVFQRQCCGPGRAFQMSITDNNNKEVMRLDRPRRCLPCYFCCSCCSPNVIEVQAPPGNVVGYVKQDGLGIIRPWFFIQNADGETILKIKGPVLGCACYADANFEVLSADGQTNVGRISKQWGGLAKEYFTDADNFGIQFPMDLDVKMKAVMLGAVFLIDFMFFESAGGGNQNGGRRAHY